MGPEEEFLAKITKFVGKYELEAEYKDKELEKTKKKDQAYTTEDPEDPPLFRPFEQYSEDTEVEKTQKQEGIGYAEKVMSFLDDQAHTPQITTDIIDDPETASRGTNKGKQHTKTEPQILNTNPIENLLEDENKANKGETQDEITLSPNESIDAQVEESPMLGNKSSSMRSLLSSISRGRIRSASPDTKRKESGSIFGSLLRKGGRGSRSGSRQSSVERDSQYLGSEDEGRSASITSDIGSDVGSENSLVLKFKKLTKRKPPKVKTADFDELFARGMAKSAQLDSGNNKDPFKTNNIGAKISTLHHSKEKELTGDDRPKSPEQEFLAKITKFVDTEYKDKEFEKTKKKEQPYRQEKSVEGKQPLARKSIKNKENYDIAHNEIKKFPISPQKDIFTDKEQ